MLADIKKAGPSTPVAVMGLTGMPSAGDIFQVVESEKEARNIVAERVHPAAAATKAPTSPAPTITTSK